MEEGVYAQEHEPDTGAEMGPHMLRDLKRDDLLWWLCRYIVL
jgi:hypothetical protein